MTKEVLPGPGSGALREGDDAIATCLDALNDQNIGLMKAAIRHQLAALSLSSPTEPRMEGLRYEKIESNGAVVGFNLWVLGLSMGYYGIDSPHGRELAKLAAQPTPQASSEIREALETMTSFAEASLAKGGVIYDREYLLAEIAKARAALAPSRQGAGT